MKSSFGIITPKIADNLAKLIFVFHWEKANKDNFSDQSFRLVNPSTMRILSNKCNNFKTKKGDLAWPQFSKWIIQKGKLHLATSLHAKEDRTCLLSWHVSHYNPSWCVSDKCRCLKWRCKILEERMQNRT